MPSSSSSSSSTSPSQISAFQLPWKLRLFLRIGTFLMNATFPSHHSVNRWLIGILDLKVPPSTKPLNGVFSSDFVIDTPRDLWVRIFTPTHRAGADSLTFPVVIFYHGGGFVFCHTNSVIVDLTARWLARELRAVVVSVNYRLAPEYKFPCQYEDGFDGLKFIDEVDDGALPANADLSRCFIVGESAGGNLGHHVAVKASEYEFKKVKVVGLIATQPFFGGEERTEPEIRISKRPPLTLKVADKFWKAFLPAGSDRDHPAANVFGPNGVDISEMNFPATLIIVGGLDPLQEWQRRYFEGLKRMGKEAKMVEFPNAIHGFFLFRELPECSWMIQEMRDFMANQITD